MESADVRRKFIEFYKARGHIEIPSAPLVPENDPTTLFTSSGMQPLVPYLLGQPHPAGKRLVNSQKSFRAQDIEEVGDNHHTTFFEMLGNWSLGDYFKKEQLPWIFEFLTRELGIDPQKLLVTVFEGNEFVPKDTESIEIWKAVFNGVGIDAKEGMRIFAYPASKNWWSRSGEPENMPAGEPGGPDSEVFFDFGEERKIHENSPFRNQQCHPNCDCGRFLEIANSVFMQYRKDPNGSLSELPQKNVDFGGGLERISAAVNNTLDLFQTDLFLGIIGEIELAVHKKYGEDNKLPFQIVADHLRAAVFLIKEGIRPSNKSQGYILRRLLRRATVKLHSLGGGLNPSNLFTIADRGVLKTYDGIYFDRFQNRQIVDDVLNKETETFIKSLDKGLKLVGKISPFDLFQTYGFPLEITAELLKQRGEKFDEEEFQTLFRKHQDLSRTASKGMFKGGLADHSERVTKLHTATHLLHAALRKFLGDHVEQRGSNITSERLRFDFTHSAVLADGQRKHIEAWVNEQIQRDLPVSWSTMTLKEAKTQGALAFFGERYGDRVTVYVIGDEKTGIVSTEVCGGPHVAHTGEIGALRLGKEKSASSGIRRVYATVS